MKSHSLTRLAPALLLLLALWFILCRQLSGEWSANDQYSYGWFVPIFVLYLFWLRWETREEFRNADCGLRISKQQRALVIGAVVLALLILFPVRLFEVANPDWRPLGWVHAFAVIAITFVVIYLARGWAWVKHFSFPILFFLVAVPWISPIEEPIVQGLMRTVAAAATEAITLCGVPAQLEGNLIRVSTGLVGVNEACSGVRSLQTSLMIGLLFGELKRLSIGRRFALVFGALAIAVVANFARAFFLVWVAAHQGVSAVERWHDFAGYTIVGVVFGGSLLLAAALGKGGRRKAEGGIRPPTSDPPEDRFAVANLRPPTALPFILHPSSFILSLAWLLAVEIGVEGWYRAHERNLIPRSAWSVRAPENANGFRELKIDEAVRSTLRFDTGREVVWKTSDADAAGSSATNYLFFFRWNPGSSSVVRARAHRPDICLPSTGWKQIADHGMRTYLARDGIALPARHISFRKESGNAVVHTFFCLQEDKVHREEARPDLQMTGGAQPDWSLKARARMVRRGVRNLGQQVLEFALLNTRPIDDQAAEARFAALVREMVISESRK
ncbi:MAG: hypothetical protein DLM73_14305 [Chthoniobacterales bacterium]|nr:MAG: hypothetical protein DLM73_14305 [Chthoniobacterales bacterium]